MAAAGDRPFCGRDLADRAAEVDRGRAVEGGGPPRDRAVERPVDLEDPGAVAEALVDSARSHRQAVPGDGDGGARRGVEDDRRGRRQLGEAGDVPSRLDRPAQRSQLGGQAVGNRRRAAPDHRPPDGVGVQAEDEPERGGERAVEVDHRVSGEPGKQGAGGFLAKGEPRERRRGQQRRNAEPGEGQRMARSMENGPHEIVGVCDERPEQPAPGGPVRPQGCGRLVDRSLDECRSPVVEGMADRRIGLDDLDATRRKVDRAEERRGEGQRQDRRADVVAVAGERQFLGPRPTPDRRGRLVDVDGSAGAGEGDGRGEPVGARPDDDRIRHIAIRRRGCRGRTRSARRGTVARRDPTGTG